MSNTSLASLSFYQVTLFVLTVMAAMSCVTLAYKDTTDDEELIPAIPLDSMAQLDGCLFACYLCYDKPAADTDFASLALNSFGTKGKGSSSMEAVLMQCANKVCMEDLPAGKKPSIFWRLTCPQLRDLF